MDVAGLARGSERNLPFEVEVVLAAAAQLAREAMRGSSKRCVDLAAQHRLRRRHVAFPRQRLLERQHRRQRFILDLDELRRRPRLVERRRRERRHRLSLVLDHVGGERRLVGADRRDVVPARDIGRGHDDDIARGGERARELDATNTGMGVWAQHQHGVERAGHSRDIIEVARLAGHMTGRAVVAHGSVHSSADACERFVHNASSRTATVELVSCWNRRNRPAAARRR